MAVLFAAVVACSQSAGPAQPPSAPTPALSMASPSDDVTATNGVVHVEIRVEGDAQSVQLLVDGAPLVTLRAPFRHDWNTSSLPEASYELRAEMVSGGQTYESAPKTVVVDRTTPQPPGIDSLVCTASATSIALTGEAEAGATVSVYEGSATLASAVASPGGNWSGSFAAATGSHTFVATARDAAGNVSDASAPLSVTVDGSLSPVPDPPTLTRPLPALTNYPSLWVQGVAQAGNTVYVYWDGVEATRESHLAPGHFVVTVPDGTWGTFVDVPEGAHVFTVAQWSALQCKSRPTAPQTVVGDFTHPGTPTFTGQVPDIVNVASPDSFTVSGTAEAQSTVRVYGGASGGTYLGSAQATGSGEWTVTVAKSSLPEATYALVATATDLAGNTSSEASTAKTMLVDVTPPPAPGFSQVPSIVNAASSSVTASGTAEGRSSVRLYRGATLLGTVTAVNGAWSISFTASTLPEGTYSLSATATDAAGNTSAVATTASILVDRTAPSAPTLAVPSTGKVNLAFQANGGAERNSTVMVYEVVGTTRKLLAQTTAVNGAWSVNLTLTTMGEHTLTATATDGVGNVSAESATAAITLTQ